MFEGLLMYANEELRMSNAAPRVAVGRTTVATRGGGGVDREEGCRGELSPLSGFIQNPFV